MQKPAPTPADLIAKARTGLVVKMVELAKWCHKVELFEERDKVWAEILELDPDHLEAHKGLGHSRGVDGAWKETKRHVWKNRSTKALPELPAKRAETMKAYSEELVAHARAAPDPAVREKFIDAVTSIDPDDATVHAYRGDVQDGDAWVLPETVVAREQRGLLKALVRSSYENVPPVSPEPTLDTDPQPAFTWTTRISTGFVRVLATVPEEDAQSLARMCTAAGFVGQGLFGEHAKFPPRYTIYLLQPEQKHQMLATFTAVSDEERARMAKLEGTGLYNRQDVALWNGNQARSVDAAVRQTLSFVMGRGFGLTPDCGWVWEGFGLYLTREITGTRLTWFVSAGASPESTEAAAMQVRLLAQDANWMNEALLMLSGPEAPKLGEVMKQDLYHLQVRDVVASYALAAYLIEGQPKLVAELARRSCAGEDPEKITLTTLSMTTEQLRQRVVRWLSERR